MGEGEERLGKKEGMGSSGEGMGDNGDKGGSRVGSELSGRI